MKKLYFHLILTFCVLANVITVSCASSGEKLDLKLRLQEGKTYTLRMVNDQKMINTVQGREMEMSQKMSTEFTFDVQNVDEAGDATVEVNFQAVSAEMEGPMGKISYDSANPTEVTHPMVKALAAMAGQSYTVVLSEKGEVKKVEGMKEIMARVIESLDLPDGQAKEMMEKQFENMFGDQATVEMMGQWFSMIPDQPVSVGDSWSKTVFETTRMPVIIENKWTLKERKAGVAVVDMESEIKSNLDAEPMDMGPVKLTMDISGEQSGTYELDESTGWIVSAKVTQQISGDQIIEGGQSGTMTIPMTMEMTVILESL